MTFFNHSSIRPYVLMLAVGALSACAAPVAGGHDGMAGMDHSKMHHSTVDLYAPAMETMHKDMSVPATGDADVDFVRGMIPHHQGAIDMAKVVQQHGKDPEIKKLADGIVSAQEKEISFMRDWLKKNGK